MASKVAATSFEAQISGYRSSRRLLVISNLDYTAKTEHIERQCRSQMGEPEGVRFFWESADQSGRKHRGRVFVGFESATVLNQSMPLISRWFYAGRKTRVEKAGKHPQSRVGRQTATTAATAATTTTTSAAAPSAAQSATLSAVLSAVSDILKPICSRGDDIPAAEVAAAAAAASSAIIAILGKGSTASVPTTSPSTASPARVSTTVTGPAPAPVPTPTPIPALPAPPAAIESSTSTAGQQPTGDLRWSQAPPTEKPTFEINYTSESEPEPEPEPESESE